MHTTDTKHEKSSKTEISDFYNVHQKVLVIETGAFCIDCYDSSEMRDSCSTHELFSTFMMTY